MIPVQPQPEPPDFDTKVRQKGLAFLQKSTPPVSWSNGDYWTNALPDLYQSYQGVCAYCCEWIPRTVGAASVEHFVPKANSPHLAYEWDNYRLVSSRFNGRKSDYQDVLDPFLLDGPWFILKFPALMVVANPNISPDKQEGVAATVARLKLNDEICIESRRRWIRNFIKNEITYPHLKRHAPFLASELERQGLSEKIGEIMRFGVPLADKNIREREREREV